MVRPIRYPEMYAGPEAPGPAFAVGTNLLVDELSTGGAETILAHLETATAAIAAVQLRVLGGAMARVADDATAFGHRRAKLMVNIAAMDQRVEERAEHETWAAGLAEALSGGVTTPAYVGFIGEEGEEGVRRAYPPATLKRLAQVKRRYDPDNLFHLNLNVAPEHASFRGRCQRHVPTDSSNQERNTSDGRKRGREQRLVRQFYKEVYVDWNMALRRRSRCHLGSFPRLATRRPNRSAGVPGLLLSPTVRRTGRTIRSRRSHCGRRQGGRALETAWNTQGRLSWHRSHRPARSS